MRNKDYEICNILASVTASKRSKLLDELRELGENLFLGKYANG